MKSKKQRVDCVHSCCNLVGEYTYVCPTTHSLLYNLHIAICIAVLRNHCCKLLPSLLGAASTQPMPGCCHGYGGDEELPVASQSHTIEAIFSDFLDSPAFTSCPYCESKVKSVEFFGAGEFTVNNSKLSLVRLDRLAHQSEVLSILFT